MKKLFVVLCMFFCIQVVYADSTINSMSSDGFKISVNAQTGSANSTLSMKLTKDNKVINAETGVEYYVVFIKNQSDAAPYSNSNSCNVNNDMITTSLGGFNAVSSDGTISIDGDWYIAGGFEYAYVVKYKKTSQEKVCTVSSEPLHVEKPALPLVNKRYKVYVSDTASLGFDDAEIQGCPFYESQIKADQYDGSSSLVVCPLFPYIGSYGDHKFYHSTGTVNDSSIIEKIKNHESDAYDSLLTYARRVAHMEDDLYKDTNRSGWSWKDNEYHFITPFTSSYEDPAKEGVYYFIYTTYEDSVDYTSPYKQSLEKEYWDIYRSVEGVNLLQVKNGKFISIFDWDKPSVTATPSVTTKPTSTPSVTATPSVTVAPKVTNPKTGTISLIVIGLVLMISFMGGLYYYRLLKNNNKI